MLKYKHEKKHKSKSIISRIYHSFLYAGIFSFVALGTIAAAVYAVAYTPGPPQGAPGIWNVLEPVIYKDDGVTLLGTNTRIINLHTPIDDRDAASKSYIDTALVTLGVGQTWQNMIAT